LAEGVLVTAWSQWIGLGVTSGVAAGTVNQLLSWARETRDRAFARDQKTLEREHHRRQQELERDHQKAMLNDQRSHESQLRAERAHFEERGTFLPMAQEIRRWLYSQRVLHFGGPSGNVGLTDSRPLPDYEHVSDYLEQIATGHPTREIRNIAKDLDAEIEERFLRAEGPCAPTEDELQGWMDQTARLIRCLHEPPHSQGFPDDPPRAKASGSSG
jgi:hypothetical protein